MILDTLTTLLPKVLAIKYILYYWFYYQDEMNILNEIYNSAIVVRIESKW